MAVIFWNIYILKCSVSTYSYDVMSSLAGELDTVLAKMPVQPVIEFQVSRLTELMHIVLHMHTPTYAICTYVSVDLT